MDWSTEADWPLPFRSALESGEPFLESDEAGWVRNAAAGDEASFVLLVQRYETRVFHFCCHWLSSEEDAKEATQDTFIRAYLALDRYRPKARFSTWLFQIALNLCRDRLKSKTGKQSRLTVRLDGSGEREGLSSAELSPDEAAARTNEEARLEAAIQMLPEPLRAIVIICGIEGMSQETCAEILNLSVRAVEGRYYRAKRKLETLLEET